MSCITSLVARRRLGWGSVVDGDVAVEALAGDISSSKRRNGVGIGDYVDDFGALS
jgi:hypothetical protein